MKETLAVAIWLGLLALAFPYVRRVKHPDTKPLAAYMIFVIVFSLISGLVFLALTWFALEAGLASALGRPLGALVFLALVLSPAFLFARWLIGRPPLKRPLPK